MPNTVVRRTTDTAPADERVRRIVERLPDGIVVLDREGCIRFANPAAERLFGRPARELLGQPFGFAVDNGEPAEIEVLQRGGRVVCAELRSDHTEWESQPAQLVALRDITDRKRAEEHARQLAAERVARAAAEAADAAKSTFLALMSHELRTPLNAVIGYAELVELGVAGPLTRSQEAYLARIRVSGRHLLLLLNDVLDLVKDEGGRLAVAREPASAAEALECAVTVMRPETVARGISLTIVPPASPPPLYLGDEERVRQILIQLLSNAVKFTGAGGRITASSGATSAADADARVEAPELVFFRVTDTGIGIPEEQLHTIFDPFVQTETGHTRTAEGTGLGLTIGRRLARRMGGDLTVRSTRGSGSSFTLWLPAARARDGAAGREPSAAAPPPPRASGELRAASAALLRELQPTLHAIVERLRADDAIPTAADVPVSHLADHLAVLLADLAGAVLVISETGLQPSALLTDAADIRRLVSARHGAQRARLGWSEKALRREFAIIREEVAETVRRCCGAAEPSPEEAITLLDRLLGRAEHTAVGALSQE